MKPMLLAIATAVLIMLAGCSGDDPAPSASSPSTSEPSESAEPVKAPRRPKVGDCYRLTYAQALAPIAETTRVKCKRKTTAVTFHVGRIERNARGAPRPVDSDKVQNQVSDACPQKLQEYLGGTPDQLRRSLVTTVWFTPTLEQASAGAAWFRCDVVAPGAGRTLMLLPESLEGAMEDDALRERFALCATGEPGKKSFTRTPCTATHAWRAVSTVDLTGDSYPGPEAIATSMDEPCTDAATEAAANPLDVRWSQEGPTKSQWQAGRRYGICWIPS